MSLNGTKLILRDGGHLELRGATHSVTIGDRVQVQPGLEIVRSGRRYPSKLSGRWITSQSRPGESPGATVSVWNPP